MANRSEAYDLSYFEDISSVSTAAYELPQELPQESPHELPHEERGPKRKVVQLPKRHREPQKKQRPQQLLNIFAMIKCVAVVGLIFGISMAAVFSDVRLTELSEEISAAQSDLAEARSLEVQLTMQATQMMSDAEVEKFAVEQLGMGKLSGSQVVYLHVAQQDRGTVLQEAGEGSWLDRMIAEVKSWFS